MTTDIVERLREPSVEDTPTQVALRNEAAAEIERLCERLNILWVAFQDNDAFRRVWEESQ